MAKKKAAVSTAKKGTRFHFISGLPRSGSTLLAALLRQNPRFFHGGMSSPVAQLLSRIQHATSRGTEGAVLVSDEQRIKIMRGLFLNFYDVNENSAEVILDTNRLWCAKMALLHELFPGSKVIAMVRDIQWIMNSVEKLIQSNPLELSGMFNWEANTTVYSRIQGLANGDGLVGYALNAVREAYFGAFAKSLMLVDYEALARYPADTMAEIYKFLGEPVFEHDFEKFEYEAHEFDAGLGMPGLHKVSGPVSWVDQDLIIPPGIAQNFAQDSFWRNQAINFKHVPVVYVPPPEEPVNESPRHGVARRGQNNARSPFSPTPAGSALRR